MRSPLRVLRFRPPAGAWMAGAIGILLCGLAGAEPAPPPKATGASLPLGYVDVKELLAKYEQYQADKAAMANHVNQSRQLIQQRMYLTELEWQELDDLQDKVRDKAKLSADEQKRLEELNTLSKQRERDLRSLQALREPSDEQRTERKRLESILRANTKRIKDLDASLAQEARAKEEELTNRLQDNIRKAVEATAAAKSLVMVVDKTALLFVDPSLDITAQVLERLNAKKKPGDGEAK